MSGPLAKAQDVLDAHRKSTDEHVYGITELAATFSLTPRAIRFYETKGLLRPRRIGNTRIYSKRERVRLQLILRGKSLGMSLDEIKEYLDLYGERGEGRQKQLERVVASTTKHILELQKKKADLDETLIELALIRSESQKGLRALSTAKRQRKSRT